MRARGRGRPWAAPAGPVDGVHWRPPREGVWPPLFHLGRAVLRLVMPRLFGVRVSGRAHLPRRGGALLVANHLADVDPPFVAWACMPRRVQYVALARHFTRLPLALLLTGLGAFPIRAGGDHRALRYARDQVAAGRLVLIFPEGRPGFAPRLGPFGPGAGHIGVAAGEPVVPVAIWGTHRIMRGRRPVGRGPVSVAFGPPLRPPAEGSRRARADALTRSSREAVARLLAELVAADPDRAAPAAGT